MTKRIVVDEENSAETWWAATVIQTMPVAFRPLSDMSVNEITVTDEEADEIIAWAELLPGYDAGPEYAPHPFTVHDA